jgi:RNA polymerase sigma-70 factor (sigma-E family)
MTASAREGRWDADTAVEELYAAHYRRLVRLSSLLVRDVETAEEVVQDAFVAMHGTWRTLREPEKGLAYLRQAVVNRSRSVLRHRGVQTRYADRAAGATGPTGRTTVRGTDEDALASERRSLVLDALRELPVRQREVLALRYYLDLSEADIASTLGISRGAVKTHASRGVAALRSLMEDDS